MGKISVPKPKLLFDKIWDAHLVSHLGGGYDLVYIARHMLHELASDVAFNVLAETVGKVRHPNLTFATHDHVVSTGRGRASGSLPEFTKYIEALRENTKRHQIRLFDMASREQGIVHVVAPELGVALPGLTFVCGDSHTCTVGGLGSLAWGIGTSEVAHVLATQTLVQRRPRVFRIKCEGSMAEKVSAKDLILAMIGRFGSGAGTDLALEFHGGAITRLSVEERLTLCNLSIEMGARIGLVAPDDTTIEYLADKPFSPRGVHWDKAVRYWRSLKSEPQAIAQREENFEVESLVPQVTWGTSPSHVMSVNGHVPDPRDAKTSSVRIGMEKALAYMDLVPGQKLTDVKVDVVFIGSCANSRISDLRAAAAVLKGRKIASGVRALVVPGSTSIRQCAEREGLDKVFKSAGFEWRHSGCSMCVALNGDRISEGKRCVSTSNRNFEGRQGSGARTHLASPATAAASALTGRICDQLSLQELH